MPCQDSECPLVIQTLQGFCQDSEEKCQHFAGTLLMLFTLAASAQLAACLCSNSDSSSTFVLHPCLCRTWWRWYTPSCFPSALSCSIHSCSQCLYRSLYFKVIATQISFHSLRKYFNGSESGTCPYLLRSWQLAAVSSLVRQNDAMSDEVVMRHWWSYWV